MEHIARSMEHETSVANATQHGMLNAKGAAREPRRAGYGAISEEDVAGDSASKPLAETPGSNGGACGKSDSE